MDNGFHLARVQGYLQDGECGGFWGGGVQLLEEQEGRIEIPAAAISLEARPWVVQSFIGVQGKGHWQEKPAKNE